MKKVFLFLTMLLFAFTGTMRADVVEIGSLDGAANNSYLPMNSLYEYSFSEQIYTAEEIGMAGTINELTMWLYGNTNLYTMPFDIYMVEVDKDAFESTSDWVTVTEADKVYSGEVTVHNTDAEAYTFTLDTPFQYSGEGNLLIAFNNKTGSWKSGLNGKVFGASGDAVRAIYARRDGTIYDITNLPAATSTTYQRNVITLDITAGGGGGGEPATLTVYDGENTNSYVPVYGFYADAYLRAQYVIPAEDLAEMNGGTVNQLTYYLTTPAAEAWTGTFRVYMTEVADATISAFVDPDNATVVYEGLLDATGETMVIPFDATYVYNGGNLLIGFDEYETGNYKSATFAGTTVTGASVQGYNYSSITAVSPTQRNFIPETTFDYITGGDTPTPPEPPVVVADIVTDPEEINLGYRPIGCWMEPYTFKFMSVDADATINQVINGSDAFMTVNLETPVLVEFEGEGVDATITTGTATPGEVNEQFAIDFVGARGLKMFNMTATAYEPAEGDVWENAIEVTSFPFNGNASNVYKNYTIENQAEGAADAVYKVTFDTEVMLTAGTNGANGVARLFTEDFNGQPGPKADNHYEYSAGGGYPPYDGWFSYSYTDNNTFFGTSAGGGMIYGYKVPVEYLAGYGHCYLTQVEAAARESYPYNLYVLRGGDTPAEATLVYYQEMPEPATAYYFFDMDVETPFEIGEEENLWVMFYSESPYAAYCGKVPVDVENAKIWYTLNGTTWNSNTTYTPVIYLHLEYPYSTERGGVVMNLADMSITPNNGKLSEANGNVNNMPKHNTVSVKKTRDGYPMLYNAFVPAGTYYLVVASTDQNFDVYIQTEDVPAPEQANVTYPTDGTANVPTSFTATWELGDYTTEMQVKLGTQYPPQTILVDWTNELFESYNVTDLLPNQSYFLQVNERNSAGTTEGEIIAFTTIINGVEGFEVEEDELYPGEAAVFTWEASRSHKGYNMYMDGVKINETLITTNEYSVEGLEYNMDGYDFQVTNVYDAGESSLEDAEVITVYMTGFGTVSGHVYDTDENHPIAGATVMFVGVDEYETAQTFTYTTDASGFYTGEILAGMYVAGCVTDGYENTPYGTVYVAYDETVEDIDIITHEFYYPLGQITATEQEEENNVLVEWSWNPAEMMVDFETGDFSQADFTLPATYPWAITTSNAHAGTYCMKSTCEGQASTSSSIEVTVDVPYDGKMGFWVAVSSEANYDKFHFYIDGIEKGAAISGVQAYAYKEFDVTEGTHTYKWEYTKDSSVNSNDDCAYVDDITLYRYEAPLPPVVGATTYDFDDDTMMGWTSIDADGDGNGWVSSANPGIYHNSGVNLSGTGNNSSEAYVLSGSYANQTGQALTPDNYLVSPAQIAAENGAQIQFWACAQDASYAAEHFGVAVSTTTATAGAFTTVQEWTMTAKGAGTVEGNSEVRGTRQGSWYQFAVDLSAYAGQDIWVAIRHFNCTDMFILNVDDITLATGGSKIAPRNTREFQSFNLYRRDVQYGEEAAQEQLITSLAADVFEYTDESWNNLPYGEYQWGIQAVYDGYAPVDRGERTEVVIGEGATTNSYLPTYTYYNYSLTEQIYTAAEIGNAGTISSVSFFNTGADRVRDIAVYMANTTKTGFDDNYDWVNMTAANKVFEGTVTFVSNDWTTITLSSPFSYNGTNLVIAVDDNTASWESGVGFKADNTTENMAIRAYNDYTDYDPATATTYSGTPLTVKNQIKLDIAGSGPVPPTPGDGLSEILWSNTIVKDMEATLTFTVSLNNAQSSEGATVSATYDDITETTFVGADGTAQLVVRKGISYDIAVEMDGYATWNPTGNPIFVTEDLSYTLMLQELVGPAENFYVSPTGWARWDGTTGGVTPGPGPQPGPGGNSFTEGFEGGLNGWNVLTVNAAGGEWLHSDDNLGGYDYTELAHTGTGFAMCYSYVDYVGAFNTDSYMYTPQKYAIENGSTLTFWADNANDQYPENFSVCVATADNPTAADFTQVWSGGAKGTGNGGAAVRHQNNRYQNWRSHNIDLSAYAGQEVYIAFHDVNYDMYEIWIDDVELSAGSKGDRAPLSYKMMLDGEYLGETYNPFYQFDVDGMEIGSTHVGGVAPLYASGMGDWVYYTWTYSRTCDEFEGVTDFNAAVSGHDVTLTWTMPNGSTPTPPTPPTGGWTEDFESGSLPAGWAMIDADGDGNNWLFASATMGTGYGHNGSSDLILSQSYSNTYGALTPDNYLVTPQVTPVAGSTFSFYACAQDNAWASEHFGVAVSTGSQTNANDFTMLQEWTMTAKGMGIAAPGRDGDLRTQGNWYEYSVDLSAYAGQAIYLAIRHFNCTDWFYLDVDDVTFTTSAKGNDRDMWDYVASFSGSSAGQQAVCTDGTYIYTASWQTTPTGGHTFYQYNMDGTFVEGFDITGATGIRDITTDGEYFYATSGGAQIFILDFATRTLVGTINCSGLTSRHISYDPVRDGFWSGNWSTMALYSRTGALIQNGPAPSSAYGSAYYKDADDVEHLFLFCQPNSDAKVYDFNITTNTISANPVLDFASTPGFNAAIAGGCFIGEYNGNTCWYGNAQQDPNLIGIYEIEGGTPGPGPGPGPQPTEGILGAYLLRNGEFVNFFGPNTTSYVDEGLEAGEYEYTIIVAYDGEPDVTYYATSCGDDVIAVIDDLGTAENDEIINSIYPNPTKAELYINATSMKHVTVFNTMGQVVFSLDVDTDNYVLNMGQYEAGVYMVKVDTVDGSSVKRITVVK